MGPNFWRSPLWKIRSGPRPRPMDLPREMVGELIGKIILISYHMIWELWELVILSIGPYMSI